MKEIKIITSLHKSTNRDYLKRMNNNKIKCIWKIKHYQLTSIAQTCKCKINNNTACNNNQEYNSSQECNSNQECNNRNQECNRRNSNNRWCSSRNNSNSNSNSNKWCKINRTSSSYKAWWGIQTNHRLCRRCSRTYKQNRCRAASTTHNKEACRSRSRVRRLIKSNSWRPEFNNSNRCSKPTKGIF